MSLNKEIISINKNINQFIIENTELESPCIIVDLDEVIQNLQRLQKSFPFAHIYYSIKANSAKEILTSLASHDCSFDVASIGEIENCLGAEISEKKLRYGNTIKKSKDIKKAFDLGVEFFDLDSEMEVEKLAKHAPGSKVFIRLLTTGEGAAWPLCCKFGRNSDKVFELFLLAKKRGLEPYGLCFHVGSQQLNLSAWDNTLCVVSDLRNRLRQAGIELNTISLGGGFPCVRDKTKSIEQFGEHIYCSLKQYNLLDLRLVLEPGRFIVASAGVLRTEAILVQHDREKLNPYWVYLDTGLYNGMFESTAIILPVVTENPVSSDLVDTILAGPTCDSADMIGEGHLYRLPKDIDEGDKLLVLDSGAYGKSYALHDFNGFQPIAEYFIKKNNNE